MVCALCRKPLARREYHTCIVTGVVQAILEPIEGPPIAIVVRLQDLQGSSSVTFRGKVYTREMTARGDTLYASLRFFEMEDP